MEKKNNKGKVIKIVIYSLVIIIAILSLFAQDIFGKDSIFNIFKTDKNGIKLLGNFINKNVPLLLQALLSSMIIYLIFKLLRYLITKILKTGKKGRTAAKLIDSFLKYLAAILIIFNVLKIFGVSTTTLLASIGILGLIIGLGAQSLISDIISGLFIVFEGDYEVGDYIVIEGFRGIVESIGLRTTRFIDYAGNIKVINNSEIKTVVNLSKNPSGAVVEVTIAYDDFDKAEKELKDYLPEISNKLDYFINGPEYLGPSNFIDYGITLLFFGEVKEELKYKAERDLRRELKHFFDKHNIEIAYPKYLIKSTNDLR